MKSKYETKTRVISRDGGGSVALPDGHDLWLFGDTGIYQRSGTGPWKSTDFIDGSTAMLTKTTKGAVPSGGEVPSGAPKRFIPTPKNVFLPNGSGKKCTTTTAAFPARWPTGAAMLSKQEVLITYSMVCVTTPGGHAQTRAEGWGYMLYNWKTHRIDHGPIDVFKPKKNGAALSSSKIFVSPQVKNGVVTMFASQCTTHQSVGCASGLVWAVTVKATPGALDRPASYKPVQLRTDGASKWQPLSISVGRYGSVLRLVAHGVDHRCVPHLHRADRERAVEAHAVGQPARLPESHGLLLRARGPSRAEHGVAHVRVLQEPRFRAGRPCRGQRDSELATTT